MRTLDQRPSIVVTGGARGIGAAIAERFLVDGADVTIADLQRPEGLRRAAFVETDVASSGSVRALFDEVAARRGRVDVLVNDAAIWFPRPFADISVEEWDRVLGVNLRGTFLCTQAAVALMPPDGGSVINIGSQAGLTVTRGQGAHYHASKAAVSHLTKALAFELGVRNIRVNTVAPGATPADPAAFPPALLAQIPLGRVGTPGDIAGVCAFLASRDGAFITGQTILVNGGAVAFL